MKTVLFIVSSANQIGANHRKTGYSFPEVAYPYAELTAKGVSVEFATIEGGEPTLDDYNPEDSISRAFYESMGFQRLNNSRKLSEINTSAYDAIFFPGGLGPMADMVENASVKEAIVSTYESGRIVSAVCHGPAALLGARLSNGRYLVEGKKLTAFTNDEEQKYAINDVPFLLANALKEQGAEYAEAPLFAEHVVVDGNLITGQNPASAAGVARAILAAWEKNTNTYPTPEEIVSLFYKRLGEGDAAGSISLLAENIEWRTPMGVPWGGHYYSRDEVVKGVFERILAVSSVFTPNIERIIEAGDKAISVGSYIAETKTGKPFRIPFVSVWQVKDGKAINLDQSVDGSELQAALQQG